MTGRQGFARRQDVAVRLERDLSTADLGRQLGDFELGLRQRRREARSDSVPRSAPSLP